MKKTVSILLTVAMMLATLLAIIPVSASPGGEAIRTAEDFADMTLDGKYYLANSIVLTESYNLAFSGTLDGNGYTITVRDAIPIFANINGGVVRNLNIRTQFEVEKPYSDFGALAKTACGTFESINADIDFVFTAEATANNIGGLFASVNGETEIRNVVVNGSIKQQKDNNQNQGNIYTLATGGIIGSTAQNQKITKVAIRNSTNNANIYSGYSLQSVGGIIGAASGQTDLTIENCQNYGSIDANITASNNNGVRRAGIGGMLGTIFSSSQTQAKLTVEKCRNYANIVGYGNGNYKSDCMMGGIVGRAYGTPSVDITGCVNSGTITNRSFGWSSAGGILGCAETYNFLWSTVTAANIKIEFCTNLADVSGAMYNGGIMGSGNQFNSPITSIEIVDSANYSDISGNYSAGIICYVGNGGSPKLTVSNCYNSGSAHSGIVDRIDQRWEQSAKDTALVGEKQIGTTKIYTTPYPVGNITNCVNEGTVTNGIISTYTYRSYADYGYPMSDSKIKINSCVSNGTLAPTGDVYVISSPANADTVKTQVKNAVPGNPAELDVIIAKYKDHEAGDYTSGWDTFESLYKEAVEDVNKSATQYSLDSHVARLTQASKSLVLKPVDVAPLNAAIASAENICEKEALYTPRTWEVFNEALVYARYIREDATSPSARASQVINATEKLKAAQAALELKPDKTQLANAIAKYSAYEQSDYTSTSWQALLDAIAEAEDVNDNANATRSDVDAALSAMNNAAQSLAEKVDPTPLNTYVSDIANKYKLEDFTAKSFNVLRTVIRKANTAIDANDMSQEEMDGYFAELDDAVKKLVIRGDFDNIDKVLDSVVDIDSNDAMEDMSYNYTRDSYRNFKAVVDKVKNAKKEANQPNFSAEDEEKLLAEVISAVNGLVPFANYEEIDALLADVNKLDKNVFTAESWKEVEKAVSAISNLKSNRNATQREADAALQDLKKAVEGLQTGDVSDMLDNIDPARLMEALIEAKNKYRPEDYTEASYKAFETVVNTISAAMEEGELSEKEVKDYSKRLEKAIKELEKIVKKSDNEEELSEALDEFEDLDLLGCGGSISVTAIAMGTVLALGSAVLFKKKRED